MFKWVHSDFQNSLKIQKCDQQCRLIPGGYLLHASCVHKINTPYFFVINALSNLQDDPIYYNMTCDLDIRNAFLITDVVNFFGFIPRLIDYVHFVGHGKLITSICLTSVFDSD